ncbi:helix-turn-helix domain-containing protein [Metapseudomonas lalkuanensis]|uniref:GlxA family transcriptional regulator n=1 Tax=Metapseudomonas lalkuanensis TaxID=2604832 RepID=UPI001CF3D7B1|nr:helix-turn-helix domain-containing protein [Pseudomonas lalkuanensis]UCO98632.1 helix-turn-helix domain-containing protein [Pseudomonas lalkuanensis]
MTACQALPTSEHRFESIGFLLLEGFSLIALAGSLEPLRLANQHPGAGRYRWCILTCNGNPVRAGNGMQLTPEGSLAEASGLDALILCGGDSVPPAHAGLLAQLRDLAARGVKLGALESARTLLVEAGLLPCGDNAPTWASRMSLREALASAQPKLQEVIALMEANLEEPLDLDDLASFVELSRRQLERLFQKYLRCSPSRHYLKLRLLRARQLLRQTAMPVVQVASGCGFLSPQNFSKCYREHFGIPPSNERLDKPQLCRSAMH